jgi:isopentenyl-diphosphate delta-isomerase
MKIPIVDEDDNIIEYKERDNRDLNVIYRVSSLWITDTDGKILLARRAFNKSHDPGKWGPAVAGTVEEGETYEQNIIKEAEEEIGLKDIKPITGIKKRRNAKWNYFNQEFLLVLPTGFNDFKIQEDEVSEVKWFTKEELIKELKDYPDNFLKGIHERINN